MIDLHTHSLFSDGVLVPSELVRRAVMKGYEVIAITDHGDASNLDFIIPRVTTACRELGKRWNINALPGIELTAKTALIPILNLSLVCKEMLSGVWHWNYIGLIFGSTCVYAAVALALCVRMFNREDVMFRA